MNYNIKNIGIDLTRVNNVSKKIIPELNKFDYIHTSLDSNNMYNLFYSGEKIDDKVKVIATTNHLDSDMHIQNLLLILKRYKLDVLLLSPRCDYTKYKDRLEQLISKDLVVDIGLYNPKSVEYIVDFEKAFNRKVKYIALDLCPLLFNAEIITWCKNNGVEIMGFNSFGNQYMEPEIVEEFSKTYLLNFSSFYCSTVFLPSSDINNNDFSGLNSMHIYLEKLINREVISPEIYTLNKTINKIRKVPKQLISTSLIINDTTVLPCSNHSILLDEDESVVALGDGTDCILKTENDITDELIGICDSIYKVYKEELQELVTNSSRTEGDEIALLLPKILLIFISNKYNIKDWELVVNKVDNNTFFISAVKTKEIKWYRRRPVVEKTVNYIFFYTRKHFILQKLENAD